jgi:hypothetical protein
VKSTRAPVVPAPRPSIQHFEPNTNTGSLIDIGNGASTGIGHLSDDGALLVSSARGRLALGIGRSKMAELLATGEIKSVLIGRRRLIPVAELRRIAKQGCA